MWSPNELPHEQWNMHLHVQCIEHPKAVNDLSQTEIIHILSAFNYLGYQKDLVKNTQTLMRLL